MKCVILDDYQQVATTLADWQLPGASLKVVSLAQHHDHAALIPLIADATILVVMRERTPVSAELLAALPHLKLIVTSGMRNAAIDLAAASARGITVSGTDSDSAPPVELAWALILGLARHLVSENQALRTNGPWQSTLGMTLKGRRLGLIGLGKTGGQMAAIARAFGMDVLAWSQNLTEERAAACGATRMGDLNALLRESDIVSLHLVLSERTRGLLGAAELAQMQPHSLLINTSRAAIIEEEALLQALQHKRLAAAGLDVYEQEPLPAHSPWRQLDNLLATPHLGYVADTNYQRYFTQAVENINAWYAGHPIRVIPG